MSEFLKKFVLNGLSYKVVAASDEVVPNMGTPPRGGFAKRFNENEKAKEEEASRNLLVRTPTLRKFQAEGIEAYYTGNSAPEPTNQNPRPQPLKAPPASLGTAPPVPNKQQGPPTQDAPPGARDTLSNEGPATEILVGEPPLGMDLPPPLPLFQADPPPPIPIPTFKAPTPDKEGKSSFKGKGLRPAPPNAVNRSVTTIVPSLFASTLKGMLRTATTDDLINNLDFTFFGITPQQFDTIGTSESAQPFQFTQSSSNMVGNDMHTVSSTVQNIPNSTPYLQNLKTHFTSLYGSSTLISQCVNTTTGFNPTLIKNNVMSHLKTIQEMITTISKWHLDLNSKPSDKTAWISHIKLLNAKTTKQFDKYQQGNSITMLNTPKLQFKRCTADEICVRLLAAHLPFFDLVVATCRDEKLGILSGKEGKDMVKLRTNLQTLLTTLNELYCKDKKTKSKFGFQKK